ncbi:acyltransferase [Georgenia sp. MJ206]|uniref:acyltransferase n=1 Tax=Georgenia wangjunii TaxID=3117730 RepID=UPI002F26675E
MAKAGAVVLVVLYHVGRTGLSHLLPGSDSLVVAAWGGINEALLPVRMPLFFLASGILAAPAMARPWARLWRPRVVNLVWPFVLWGVIHALTAGLAHGGDDVPGQVLASLAAIPAGGTAYWYLAVLVVIFVLARLLRRAPAVLVVASVAALGVAPLVPAALSGTVGEAAAVNVGRVCYFAVWFLLGCFARPVVERVAALKPWPLVAASFVLYAGLAYLVYVRKLSAPPGVVLTVVGLAGAIAASVLLARSARVRRLAAYISRRTLAIYVVHPVLLTLAVAVVRTDDGTVLPLGSVAVDVVLAPVLTVALVWLAVLAYDISSRVWMGWLFAPPARRAAGGVRSTRRRA